MRRVRFRQPFERGLDRRQFVPGENLPFRRDLILLLPEQVMRFHNNSERRPWTLVVRGEFDNLEQEGARVIDGVIAPGARQPQVHLLGEVARREQAARREESEPDHDDCRGRRATGRAR